MVGELDVFQVTHVRTAPEQPQLIGERVKVEELRRDTGFGAGTADRYHTPGCRLTLKDSGQRRRDHCGTSTLTLEGGSDAGKLALGAQQLVIEGEESGIGHGVDVDDLGRSMMDEDVWSCHQRPILLGAYAPELGLEIRHLEGVGDPSQI